MSRLGAVIAAWQDSTWPRPSNADIARRLGVTRGAVGGWINGARPEPHHLHALSTLTGVPYDQLLTAALVDAGYLREKDHGLDPAATNRAEVSSAPPSTKTPDASVVVAMFEQYVSDANAALRARGNPEERAIRLGEIRADYVRRITDAFARERPDSSENVG